MLADHLGPPQVVVVWGGGTPPPPLNVEMSFCLWDPPYELDEVVGGGGSGGPRAALRVAQTFRGGGFLISFSVFHDGFIDFVGVDGKSDP